eukprot:TRINITY_DN17405_c0_g1_i1.p1 TRINITY_DN17405_c0_g1~~TRINITY_DN17405_c0_g1_i1.p1  ORF type:complete len:133 (-),score=30.34 TRINITY_DN17405_c0_g1_i1:208-606(-)
MSLGVEESLDMQAAIDFDPDTRRDVEDLEDPEDVREHVWEEVDEDGEEDIISELLAAELADRTVEEETQTQIVSEEEWFDELNKNCPQLQPGEIEVILPEEMEEEVVDEIPEGEKRQMVGDVHEEANMNKIS